MSATIYLDNSATTRVRDEVVEAMLPYFTTMWGNASSIHSLGRRSKQAIETARMQVAQLLNCQPDEIHFTPSATYSNNIALLGRARFIEANNLGRHVITTTIEHPAVLNPVKHLESHGFDVTYLKVDKHGLVSTEALRKAMRKDTSIVSVMWANNEVGSIQPIEEMAALATEYGAYFHTDAVQVVGKIPMDLQTINVSTLSISGHKCYAPKGIGVLYIRRGINVMPVVYGSGQEKGLCPGTEGVANIVAMGKAAELCAQDLADEETKLRLLQKIFIEKLLTVPGVSLTGPSDMNQRLPGHVSLLVPGAGGEGLVMRLDLKGICISSGSACHSGSMQASQVLQAMGIRACDASGAVRITPGYFNNETECRKAANILAEVFTALCTTEPSQVKAFN
jgi:cysteine desulfurase